MSNRLNSNRNIAGYLCLMTGLMLSLSSNTISFATYHGDQFCMADQIRIMPVNQTKLLDCVTRNLNVDTEFYYMGVAGIILLGASGILLSNLVFRRWGARTSVSDPTITFREGWWSRQRDKVNTNSTTILVIITIALVVISVWQLGEAEKLRNYTTNLLNETKNVLAATYQSNTQLSSILDKNNQLLDIQNKEINETRYQTSFLIYNAGKPYDFLIANCKFNMNTLSLTHNILITEGTEDPAPIDFLVVGNYYYSTQFLNGSTLPHNSIFIQRSPAVVGPDNSPQYDVDLNYSFTLAKKFDRSNFYIGYWLKSNPYFSPMKANVASPVNSTIQTLIGFKKDANSNEWRQITDDPNIPCR